MNPRNWSRATLAWLFGISLSILFGSLWGRAMVSDVETLGESLAPLGQSSVVGDLMANWMTDELSDSGTSSEVVAPTIEQVLASPVVEQALSDLVGEVVLAAASADPDGSRVDPRPLLAPAIPEVATSLADMGQPIAEDEVRSVIEHLDPLVIRQPGSTPQVGPGSPAASRLGTASLLAALGLITFGFSYVYVSDDRLESFRALVNRVAIGGLSFAVLLRLGSWVADPDGGRAPVPETISRLAGSQWWIPLQVAIGAAVVGGGVYLVWRYVRRAEASRSSAVSPILQPEPADSLSTAD